MTFMWINHDDGTVHSYTSPSLKRSVKRMNRRRRIKKIVAWAKVAIPVLVAVCDMILKWLSYMILIGSLGVLGYTTGKEAQAVISCVGTITVESAWSLGRSNPDRVY